MREGKRSNGTICGSPRPIGLYRGISNRDAPAIVAYLRSRPAVVSTAPRSVCRMLRPPGVDGEPDREKRLGTGGLAFRGP